MMKNLVISKHIHFRYESKILGGKTFIFHLETSKILIADKMAYEILKCIKSNTLTMERLSNIFPNSDCNEFVTNMIENGVVGYAH